MKYRSYDAAAGADAVAVAAGCPSHVAYCYVFWSTTQFATSVTINIVNIQNHCDVYILLFKSKKEDRQAIPAAIAQRNYKRSSLFACSSLFPGE
jgi:hypothetical protein